MIDLLGSSAESSTRVFSCFFLGLASGAAIAAFYSSRIRHPWRAAGFAELALAFLTIPILLLPSWTDWIWPQLGPELLRNGIGKMIKTALAFIVVYPPAVMMGLVFPLVIQATSLDSKNDQSSKTIRLYAINTFSGAVGLLSVVIIGLKAFGVWGSMLIATGLDVLIGLAMLAMHRDFFGSSTPVIKDASASKFDDERAWTTLLIAFFSGAVVLALEVLAVQMLMLVATLSLYGPAAILFSLLSCLAFSAVATPHLVGPNPSGERVARAIRRMLVVSGILILFAPIVFFGIARYSNWFASNGSVLGFMFKLILLTTITLGPAWFASGTLFPLAMISYGCGGQSRKSAARLGSLLAVNGIGGLVGPNWLFDACCRHLGSMVGSRSSRYF